MADIRLTGVNKIYDDGTHAVHDVELAIPDGEFMIMVGPSGCAKSTILRMIAGLETPTSGTIEIGGRVVNDVPPKDRDIAMVFQSYALYPHMSVRDNMSFGLRLRRMPAAEIASRVDEAARILGLEQLLDRLPKAMSGGQRQRVAMGRAIVREPQVFLMDEPLSNLDAKLRVQMRTQIAKLHQRLGTTTVYVTHDQVEAMTLGQRICILRAGVVQQVDSPSEVYANPTNVFVAGFIGSPGMNFMLGSVHLAGDGDARLALGTHELSLPHSVAARLSTSVGGSPRQVIVGIRPEHLSIARPGSPNAIPVVVDLVETMGSEAYAYAHAEVPMPDLSALSDTQASSDSTIARIDATAGVQAGSTVWLDLDLEQVHLFDPTTLDTLLSRVTIATPVAPTAIEIMANAPVVHGRIDPPPYDDMGSVYDLAPPPSSPIPRPSVRETPAAYAPPASYEAPAAYGAPAIYGAPAAAHDMHAAHGEAIAPPPPPPYAPLAGRPIGAPAGAGPSGASERGAGVSWPGPDWPNRRAAGTPVADASMHNVPPEHAPSERGGHERPDGVVPQFETTGRSTDPVIHVDDVASGLLRIDSARDATDAPAHPTVTTADASGSAPQPSRFLEAMAKVRAERASNAGHASMAAPNRRTDTTSSTLPVVPLKLNVDTQPGRGQRRDARPLT